MELHVELSEDEVTEFETVFSGVGPLPSHKKYLESMLQKASNQIVYAASMRYQAAVSGAMRWPWSQEAMIIHTSSFRFY